MTDDPMSAILHEARGALACAERASALAALAASPALQRSMPTLVNYIRDRLVGPAAHYLAARSAGLDDGASPADRLAEARRAAWEVRTLRGEQT